MTSWWSAAQLRAAIDRCERDTEAMIARHEPPEQIEGRRKGIEVLYRILGNLEKSEGAESDRLRHQADV